MKKLFAPLLMGVLLVAPLASLQAADLTKADVISLSPSLLQALSSLNGVLGQEQSREQLENLKLKNDADRLLALSTQLNQNQYGLSQTSLDSISSEVSSISNEVLGIENRRNALQLVLNSISQILSNITTSLSS